jgi:hypothetical protein
MAEPRKESLIDLVAFAKDVATEPQHAEANPAGDSNPSGNAGGVRL